MCVHMHLKHKNLSIYSKKVVTEVCLENEDTCYPEMNLSIFQFFANILCFWLVAGIKDSIKQYKNNVFI